VSMVSASSTPEVHHLHRKFVINKFYSFLRRNNRSSNDTFDIPHTNLLHVGVVHYI
jgi:hypothetical protein